MKIRVTEPQRGFGLVECLVTLLMLSLLAANTMSALKNSVRIQAYNMHLLSATRQAANKLVFSEGPAGQPYPVNNLPDGRLTILKQTESVLIRVSWKEPDQQSPFFIDLVKHAF
ncbi:MAG: prepilin-type N-terminal cleavage/methylation domain-containing protein [Gammaproteobacteria bacterium]